MENIKIKNRFTDKIIISRKGKIVGEKNLKELGLVKWKSSPTQRSKADMMPTI